MTERYTIKATPVSHKDIIERRKEIKVGDTEELRKLEHQRVRIELSRESADLKKIGDALKDLPKGSDSKSAL